MGTYRKQFQTVLLYHAIIISVVGLAALGFWQSICDESWQSCLGSQDLAPPMFLLLSIVRPFVFTPLMILALVAGEAFGPFAGTLIAATGAVLSTLVLFLPCKYVARLFIKPWLSSNLPATMKFLTTQDYKIVFITRLIPLFPLDIMSILFGVADFRSKSVIIATFIGILPETYMFAQIAGNPSADAITATLGSLTILGVATLIPLLIYEFISRKKGTSLWVRLKRTFREIIYEIQLNNQISKRTEYRNDQTPVILLYGFFSSRRVLNVLERLLNARGFQVMTFNLGGLLGVFFTRGIEETAKFIDLKIKRQIDRHHFKKVHLVAHSKGGLVALWWVLKLGGYKYCDKIVSMGTPFRGSLLTYLALFSPLGFMWRDVWQMRPNSHFLRSLHELNLPDNVRIYCFFSTRDRVANGNDGVFLSPFDRGHVIPVPMHHVTHFEFLFRREVGDFIAKILQAENPPLLEAGKHIVTGKIIDLSLKNQPNVG